MGPALGGLAAAVAADADPHRRLSGAARRGAGSDGDGSDSDGSDSAGSDGAGPGPEPGLIIAGDFNATLDHLSGLGEAGRDFGDCADAAREAAQALGVAFATLQCAELLRGGAPGIHFYTLNRSPATRAILAALKLMRPWDERDSGLAEPSLALG